MQLYSASAPVRARQIAGDVVALGLVVAFVALGLAVTAFVGGLAELGRQIEEAGAGFQGTMDDASRVLGGIPLLGGAASAPFDGASGAGQALVDAGRQQQDDVARAALVSGLLVGGLPSVVVAWAWLRGRVAFVRRASSVRSLLATPGGEELLALRALTGRDAAAALAVAPDAVAAWRSGEPAVVRRLADVALREAGVARPRG
ncbi:hypothetical protein EDF38_1059 [Frigoribacterium sp. PhB160]|uniref:hypothetical protein n=1 Tax=Frigoribacterium sp. PhB160 TaxID=2485192 RepID=UPI000F47437C|nr:hypothetical protein [Frigoribacterium sp. PhB160]ROS61959.1 hypothetical protein EDF38_1059 [Frigoribacterium sp. PhB160]